MPYVFPLMDLPVELVRIMLVSVDTWTTAEDDRVFLRWWNSMKLCCTWLYAVCKSYEPQVFKAALVTRRASLILTPHDEPTYNYHEMMPYCKLDHRREQQTPKPDTALEQSDFLRSCRMLRLDEWGLPPHYQFRWTLTNMERFRDLRTLQLSRPNGKLDSLLPVLNDWLGEVATKKCKTPRRLVRLSLCRWPGLDFKALAKALPRMRMLETLDVIECDVTDDALVTHLGPALGKKAKLYSLYLDGNPFTDDALMQALVEGGRWTNLHLLSLSVCTNLTGGLHARLIEIYRALLPNLDQIHLFEVELAEADARAYLVRKISVFKPDMPAVRHPLHRPWWTTLPGNIEDFGRRLSSRIYYWDPPEIPFF